MHFHAYIFRYELRPNATDLYICLYRQNVKTKECQIYFYMLLFSR